MCMKVRNTEPCITPKYDWQSVFSVFNFVLFLIFVFEKIIENGKHPSQTNYVFVYKQMEVVSYHNWGEFVYIDNWGFVVLGL